MFSFVTEEKDPDEIRHSFRIQQDCLKGWSDTSWMTDAAITVYVQDFALRTGRTWLVINPCVASLILAAEATSSMICNHMELGDYQSARKAERAKGPFSYRGWIIPYNEHGSHWTLLVVDFAEVSADRCVLIYELDSLRKPYDTSEPVMLRLLRVLKLVLPELMKRCAVYHNVEKEWSVPVQQDSWSCGVFVMVWARMLMTEETPVERAFDRASPNQWRRAIRQELVENVQLDLEQISDIEQHDIPLPDYY